MSAAPRESLGPPPSAGLRRLIAANAPLWAGEAEVFRVYWESPRRTRETDLLWLARQCRKELFDGVLPRLRSLESAIRALAGAGDHDALSALAGGIQEELAHFRLFAEAYDAVRTPADALLDASLLERVEWPENRELARVRARHRSENGELGRRAEAFTEGGYCTLYTGGRTLAGRGGVDDAIARACAAVVEDEWGHMIEGIAGLDDGAFGDAEWERLTRLTTEQGRCRIHMRNAQFGRPLAPDAVRRAVAGELAPLVFDFARAGFAPPAGGDARSPG